MIARSRGSVCCVGAAAVEVEQLEGGGHVPEGCLWQPEPPREEAAQIPHAARVELKGTAVNSTRTITVEIEGEGKPALVADWIGRTVYDS